MKSELAAINALGLTLHGDRQKLSAFTFQSLREHIDEVEGLLAAKDPHWKAEAIDIIIHSYLLLERQGVSMEEIQELQQKRLGRFKEKISKALSR
ncbi:MAG: hypothetical protein HQL22_08840 [Candidatus Omnitrophica bacterium]|nr:hypothetical protein [Candidatus Omnitrophota bacterium]